MIKGDTHHLQQCFLNLIFNAIEAMPKGGRLSISSGLDSTNNNIRVEIRDTGYGIPEENMDNIFDPFFTTKGEGEGTGLGLSIVHGVIKNHKGHIKIDSEVGQGTGFIIDLPAP
jgi:signal transduction histidine kinase